MSSSTTVEKIYPSHREIMEGWQLAKPAALRHAARIAIVENDLPDVPLVNSFHDLLGGVGLRYAGARTPGSKGMIFHKLITDQNGRSVGLVGSDVLAQEKLLARVLSNAKVGNLGPQDYSATLRALALRQRSVAAMAKLLPLCVPQRVAIPGSNDETGPSYRIQEVSLTSGNFFECRLLGAHPEQRMGPPEREMVIATNRFAEGFGLLELHDRLAALEVEDPKAITEDLIAASAARSYSYYGFREGLSNPLPPNLITATLTAPGFVE